MTGAQRLVVDTTGGEMMSVGAESYSVLVSSAETDGRYTLFQWITPAGSAAVPPHTHASYEETFLIVEGEVEFTLGEEQITGRAGTWVRVPAGVRHTYRNTTAESARMLVTFTPGGGIEVLFALISRPALGSQPIPIDKAAFAEYLRVAHDAHQTTYEL
jgi:quercetin dioxygenase-like cupin family protein